MREVVANQAHAVGTDSVRITVSVGVAVTMNGSVSADALVESADAALYRAKESGRNRVEGSAVPVEEGGGSGSAIAA